MTAHLVADIGHSLPGVLGAVLGFLGANQAKVWPGSAPWVAAAFVLDVDHALLGVLEAELFRLACDRTISCPRGALGVATGCAISLALSDCTC